MQNIIRLKPRATAFIINCVNNELNNFLKTFGRQEPDDNCFYNRRISTSKQFKFFIDGRIFIRFFGIVLPEVFCRVDLWRKNAAVIFFVI